MGMQMASHRKRLRMPGKVDSGERDGRYVPGNANEGQFPDLLLSNCLIEDVVDHVDLRLTTFGTRPPQPQHGYGI